MLELPSLLPLAHKISCLAAPSSAHLMQTACRLCSLAQVRRLPVPVQTAQARCPGELFAAAAAAAAFSVMLWPHATHITQGQHHSAASRLEVGQAGGPHSRSPCVSSQGAGAHVHHHEEADGLPGLPGAGAAAHVPPAQHRPHHPHPARHRLPQRGQVVLHEQCGPSGRPPGGVVWCGVVPSRACLLLVQGRSEAAVAVQQWGPPWCIWLAYLWICISPSILQA